MQCVVIHLWLVNYLLKIRGSYPQFSFSIVVAFAKILFSSSVINFKYTFALVGTILCEIELLVVIFFQVPLPVSISVGKTWGQMETTAA